MKFCISNTIKLLVHTSSYCVYIYSVLIYFIELTVLPNLHNLIKISKSVKIMSVCSSQVFVLILKQVIFGYYKRILSGFWNKI